MYSVSCNKIKTLLILKNILKFLGYCFVRPEFYISFTFIYLYFSQKGAKYRRPSLTLSLGVFLVCFKNFVLFQPERFYKKKVSYKKKSLCRFRYLYVLEGV